MKLKYIIAGLSLLSPLTAQAATVAGNLAGLTSPTGAATNGGLTREYAWTTSGGEVTVTYTLDISGSMGDLGAGMAFDTLFRRPQSLSNDNMPSGDSFTITLGTIAANTGWTLNSVTKTNTVVANGNSRDGSEQLTFSVNGDPSFDLAVPGTTGATTLTDNQFSAFDAVGDTLFIETTAGNAGDMNLRNVAFSFDVTAVPEPTSAVLLLGGLGLMAMRRRR